MNNPFFLFYLTSANYTLNDVSRLLPVVSSLIFQPLTIALHTADFFAVVVWNGVRDRIGRRVNAEALDAVEEFFLFLYITLLAWSSSLP
jgi:hypothetical protein